MNAPDEIIHQSIRLQISAILHARAPGEAMEFKLLKSLLRLTDGNLASHIATLEKAGYVALRKDFVGKKQRTQIALTRAGRKAFERHIAFLKDIVDGSQQVTKLDEIAADRRNRKPSINRRNA